ncbi:hypothetical protein [Gemmobacter denitrificans]|uniref:Capsular polysaccharide biosynthesis protein n=1 Tax=Gemmobacter denitrificans TaxID=3123040 RepID=A0ABU8BWC0_9RHOB
MAEIRLHLPAHMLENACARMPQFYRRVLDGLAGAGARTRIVHRDIAALQAGPESDGFDLVHAAAVGRGQALILGTAYLDRFFYADPKGIFFESSTVQARYRADAVPSDRAAAFLAELHAAHVVPRRSRHAQPEARASFAGGHIAVFLQDLSDPVERARHMTALQMIETVLAHRDGRHLVVKPHPRNRGPETEAILRRLDRRPGVTVTEANLHDILDGAAVSVSISSSVGLEGMLHGVPAIFFGATDLHHCAAMVERPEDWPAALNRALTTQWPYAAFLLWFLKRRNIDARRPFLDRLIQRIAEAGGDLAALGLA